MTDKSPEEKYVERQILENRLRDREEIEQVAAMVAKAAQRVIEKRQHDRELIAKAAAEVAQEKLKQLEKDRQNLLKPGTPRGTTAYVPDGSGGLRPITRRN
jgi:hypothetical protein